MTRICAVGLAALFVSTTALAQSPALSNDWVPMNWSQGECLARAERITRNLGMVRVERVGNSIFADSSDYQNQIAIRCVADRQMAFFVAAGRQGDANVTDNLTRMLTRAFREGY
jgi:hypothetical protein